MKLQIGRMESDYFTVNVSYMTHKVFIEKI